MVNKKEEVLKAMQEVFHQYENKLHENNVTTCPLCKLYHKKIDVFNNTCSDCPMHVFDIDNFGCLNRYCRPVHTIGGLEDYEFIKYEAVMEFYNEAIKALETMDIETLEKTKFRFLINIDSLIAEKYGLK